MIQRLQTRRAFLRSTSLGAAALGGLIAACGVPTPPPAPATTAPASTPAAVATAPVSVPTSAPTLISTPLHLNASFGTLSASDMPLWMGEAVGAYTRRNLQVELQFVAGDTGLRALVAGDVDTHVQSPAGMVNANLNGGQDFVYVGTLNNHSPFALMVPAGIKTAADLKGKPVASDKPGTTVDFAIRQILRLLDLQPDDVDLRIVGVSDAQLTALLSGQVMAAPLAPPYTFNAEAQGFHALITSYKLPNMGAGPIVSRTRLGNLEPALRAFMAGFREGIQAFKTQPDLAKSVLQEKVPQPSQDILDKTYDFFINSNPFQEDLEPSLAGIQALLDFLGDTSLPAAKGVSAAQLVDRRILDSLPKS